MNHLTRRWLPCQLFSDYITLSGAFSFFRSEICSFWKVVDVGLARFLACFTSSSQTVKFTTITTKASKSRFLSPTHPFTTTTILLLILQYQPGSLTHILSTCLFYLDRSLTHYSKLRFPFLKPKHANPSINAFFELKRQREGRNGSRALA